MAQKSRSKNPLFNPYKNGITSYDLAYLSSKKIIFKNKNSNFHKNYKKDFFVA